MSYTPFPPNTLLSNSEFIGEMNKALKTLDDFRSGMVVCHDDNGYWLEENGEKSLDGCILLSAAEKMVLNK